MKHLIKNIGVFALSGLFLVLSIKSSYAGDNYELTKINPISDRSIELELDNTINSNLFNRSDLEIYKSLENNAKKDLNNAQKVIIDLTLGIEPNTSYSLISMSLVEGDIIFKTGDEFIGKEVLNNNLDGDFQGIKSIKFKSYNKIELSFNKNVEGEDLEFQLLKTIDIKKVNSIGKTNKVNVILEDEILNNSEYLGTITYLETSDLERINIEKGIYYFSTGELEKYIPSERDNYNIDILEDEDSLENTLLKALERTENLNQDELLDGERELQEELNAASDDPDNMNKTQLEELALSQGKTPDTGAETWVLIFGTFIINTFYFLSRRKKAIK